MKRKQKNISLGLPLALTGIGVIASLFINKKLHAPLGIIFAGLSLWHSFEHRKKLQTDAKKLINYGKCI